MRCSPSSSAGKQCSFHVFHHAHIGFSAFRRTIGRSSPRRVARPWRRVVDARRQIAGTLVRIGVRQVSMQSGTSFSRLVAAGVVVQARPGSDAVGLDGARIPDDQQFLVKPSQDMEDCVASISGIYARLRRISPGNGQVCSCRSGARTSIEVEGKPWNVSAYRPNSSTLTGSGCWMRWIIRVVGLPTRSHRVSQVDCLTREDQGVIQWASKTD